MNKGNSSADMHCKAKRDTPVCKSKWNAEIQNSPAKWKNEENLDWANQ